MLKTWGSLLFFAVLSVSTLAWAALPLASAGRPLAEIICPDGADPAVVYAARELQQHVALISGATLPIVAAPSRGTAGQIVLAMGPEGYAAERERIGDTDGFAVRQQGAVVTVLGNQPKGVLNGIYKLLFRNSDMIWARPNLEFGTLYTPNPELTLTQTDFIDVPVYILRGWQMIGPGEESDIWQYRQGSNWSARTMRDASEDRKFGCIREFGGGHNLTGLYIKAETYFADHPEFFPYFKGARQDPRQVRARTQLCFTNPEMTRTFIGELDRLVAESPNYATYRIMIEDVWQCCECPECSKAITLPDGVVVAPTDEDFRSTQFFLWLNQIARHFQAHYPGKRLLTFGYFFTEIPPRVKVEPNISISFCPISKNSKRGLDDADNAVYYKRFLRWMENTSELTWREYFGLCAPFPRPMDAVAVADWRLVNGYGVRRTYSEMYSDAVGPRMDGVSSWNVNAPYFWVMANANWNPQVDVNVLRDEFFQRVYGPAAAEVKTFYGLIEQAFLAAPGNSRYSDKSIGNWRIAVVETGLTEPCRAALERAAAKELRPDSRKMLEALQKTFTEQIAFAGQVQSLQIARCSEKPSLVADFLAAVWQGAPGYTDFFAMNTTRPAPRRSEVRFLYDADNLYIGLQCDFSDSAQMEYDRDVHGQNKFPAGEGVEIFLASGKGAPSYYQFVIDPAGNRFSSDEAALWQVQTAVTAGGWSALVSVPWSTLGFTPDKIAQIRGTVVRLSKEPGDRRQYYPLFNSGGHSYASFCPMILVK